jgi:hypothetical protein
MAEINLSYPDFSGGEVTLEIAGRFDTRIFYKGCKKLENFRVKASGMASFRTGARYVTKSRGGAEAFLYQIDITENNSYILEFTDQKLRFFRDGVQVRTTAQAITAATQANPVVVTYTGADNFANGDSVYIYDVSGMTQINRKEFIVAGLNAGANTFQLSGVDGTAYGAYTSGGFIEKVVEVTTPYTLENLKKMKFAQEIGDTLYMAQKAYAPRKLTFTSSTVWNIATHDAFQETKANPQAITAVTKANPAVVTYDGADTFTNGDEVIISGVVGMTELNDERFTIASVNTGTNTFQLSGIDSSGYAAYSAGGIIRRVIESPASFIAGATFPNAVGFYEQRLVYALAGTLFFSRSGETDDFSLGDEVDDGIEYTPRGSGEINWLVGTENFMVVGAATDVYQAKGGVDEVITPTSISIRRTNSDGVFNCQPAADGSVTFYIQNNQLIINSYEYDFQRNGYLPVNRNKVADHITKTGVFQLQFQADKQPTLWSVRNDGQLAGLAIDADEALSAWFRWTTDGAVKSVAREKRVAQYDRLWQCVERNGVHFIEYYTDEAVYPNRGEYIEGIEAEDDLLWENLLFEAQKQYVHVDAALTYDGSMDAVSTSATITPAAATGSSVNFTASASIFTPAMVGRQIWRKSVTGLETGRAEITGYTSGTVVVCEVLEDFDSTSAIPYGEWYLTAEVIAGLEHLEGRTVSVVADGGQHDTRVVAAGEITLDAQASVVHVGLPYTGYIETLNLEARTDTGTSQTKKKILSGVGIRFLNTLYAKYGTSYYKLNQIEMRRANMQMDRPPHLFSGDLKETYTNQLNDKNDAGWSREKTVIIVQDQPYPCNVQLLVPYISVSD